MQDGTASSVENVGYRCRVHAASGPTWALEAEGLQVATRQPQLALRM